MAQFCETIKIGGRGQGKDAVFLGKGFPVLVQTMWKDKLTADDIEGEAGCVLIDRIEKLACMGCGLLRFAAPDLEAAQILGRLSEMVPMPLVADVHFDYRIALRVLDFPIAKIRINPGNIGERANVEKTLEKAGAKGVPVRIGVNAGSLPKDLRYKVDAGEIDCAEALAQAAERELAVFEAFQFFDVLVSVKASGIADTIKANRLLRQRTNVPLHIGVTEAGPLVAGTVRSAVSLFTLLREGIGDTVRVSLSDTVENEVIAAREIINAVAESRGLKPRGVTITSCPRCGRAGFDVHSFTRRWMDRLYTERKTATIAVMGCVVNGPGEARHADLGITGVGNKVILFRRGEIVKMVTGSEADAAFEEELEKL
ncbi:MAG: (E)-4-hydroxy-3-methylbut-2-enyl-diphosphate synthase [Treponema sp.]|jgi:(E)-4-hydroxy-3-methylbut-2-enyl-diphosphate synthase|nr:(E)-4-hydroxy-3-methylbut-2-enyl-diphosphate synthase [Treponema sp.]